MAFGHKYLVKNIIQQMMNKCLLLEQAQVNFIDYINLELPAW